MKTEKYSDLLCQWLSNLGYRKCFYVAGGNIMHLLESASKTFECIPFVHEVSAGIAAEFHNECQESESNKAFVLVTAGPGLTNLVTAIAGSYLESRDLLIIGGQVKTTDLKLPGMRQRGIQEIDGVSLVSSICKKAARIDFPYSRESIMCLVQSGLSKRKGPVFLEICLDTQGAQVVPDGLSNFPRTSEIPNEEKSQDLNIDQVGRLLTESERPLLLIGGEVSRRTTTNLRRKLEECRIPLMTTWNASDRLDYSQDNYFGRPNTWGMRYSNMLLQQSDLLLGIGTRLSVQQTGFNTNEFLPKGKIVQVFSDASEFLRPIPRVEIRAEADADQFLEQILMSIEETKKDWKPWLEFCKVIKEKLPLSEPANKKHNGYINPYEFYLELSKIVQPGDFLIPSSSGGAETVAMQAFQQKNGVRIATSASLASMGYGLAAAIGVALLREGTVFLVEGDGGFAQNLQELGTVDIQRLNMKIFIFDNNGYASIRMTQRNYFKGNYIGCDESTGLGLPQWEQLFDTYRIPWKRLNAQENLASALTEHLSKEGPMAFLVPIHPEQTYFPKISSRIHDNGTMESEPLHRMSPSLDYETERDILRYI